MKLSAIALALIAIQTLGAEDPKPDFNRDIRPILSGTCFKCHGMDDKSRKSGLRLDVRDAALKPAKSGEVAIAPGHPDKSELITRVYSDQPEDIMPPPSTKVELSSEQKKLLKRWVAAGAEYAPHWAFLAPKEPIVPGVPNATVSNPIDAFVAARLQSEGLKQAPAADARTLCRRVFLDMIGLPPTPAEVEAFVQDTAPGAYEKLVDRLLVSPRYGERWARRWLDLARYADTNGYEKDRARVIWPYRDWVIRALNADMPFDQFTIKQLAGDMLPNPSGDDLIATGFHRNTMLNEEGGIDPNEFRYHAVVDRTNTTSTAWMGLTAGCAQCHTHKFDPIRHAEYYQLTAFLDNADEPDYAIPDTAREKKRAELEAKIATLRAALPKKWKSNTGPVWSAVQKVEARSQEHATAAVLGDGSVKFGGVLPEQDTYTLTFECGAKEADRIRLETLKDGQAGPGRTAHGNFVLNEIRVEAARLDAPEKFEAVKLVRASADFSQHEFDVKGAIDGDPKTGWAIDGGKGVMPRTATFFFAQPVGAARWRVTLEQNHGLKHTLARFKLSLGRPADAAGNLDAAGELQRRFGEWEKEEASKATDWKVLRPSEIKTNMTLLTQLEDGSLLGSGDVTKSDTYDLKFGGSLAESVRAGSPQTQEQAGSLRSRVTGLRLEVLPHESLPGRGPGMAFYEGPKGDFFLSEFQILLNGARVKPARAEQTYTTRGGRSGAQFTQDGDMSSGWSTNGALGEAQAALFTFDPPLELNAALALKLQFERHYACPLGRFRVSVTTAANPGVSPLGADVQAALVKTAASRSDAENEIIFQAFLNEAPELAGAREEITALKSQIPRLQTTLILRERPLANPRATFVHHRGEYQQPTDKVTADVPAFLPPMAAGTPRNRLAFAQWLVAPGNPLTARVTVNRQWQAFFGRGLVRTLEDFGYQGESPSHPELLDWLALEFMKQGWSLKALHKLIAMSAAYRQDSRVTPELAQRDPNNILLARGPRGRLEAEVLRDSVLKEAGLLSEKMYGPGVFPPQPASVTTEGAYVPMTWTPSAGEDRWRRSVYTFMKRTAPFAMYSTFDGPTGEACLARREVSNSALQALTMLNDQMFVEAAQALGRKLAELKAPDEACAAELFARVLSRPPRAEEAAAVLAYVKAQRARLEAKELNAAAINGQAGEANAERAAWTLAARSVLNLDEACVKR